MTITARAYANADDAFIAWKIDAAIPGLRGFALVRERDGKNELVNTWVGPAGSQAKEGEHRPSTEWPIQKFQWTDYMVHAGDKVRYKVVPMTGPMAGLSRRDDLASDWTPHITVGPQASPHVAAYFNRGIVASQWLARRLDPKHQGLAQMRRRLDDVVKKVGDPVRGFLAGPIRDQMLALLDEAAAKGVKVYAALFELDDPELKDRLKKLGKRAHVVLANGAVKKKGDDENADARAELGTTVTISDRMSAPRALAHNKFALVCDKNGTPAKVLTGSTNWTMTGLCTQANNVLVIEDRKLAARYKREWDLLKAAKAATPDTLVQANSVVTADKVDGASTSLWFTKTSDEQELEQARALINGARQGILFVMFNPGPAGSLLNTIVERASKASPHYDPALYLHGVLNQDPSTAKHPVALFHRGEYQEAPIDVVLPAAVNEQLAYWRQELLKKNRAHAMVHSKVIVLDPFGPHPVVITGSHNLGPKASSVNDENLVIIEKHPTLAAAYAVNIMSIYNQYRWRFRTMQREHDVAARRTPRWNGTEDNDTWQRYYLKPDGAAAREIDFWLGIR